MDLHSGIDYTVDICEEATEGNCVVASDVFGKHVSTMDIECSYERDRPMGLVLKLPSSYTPGTLWLV